MNDVKTFQTDQLLLKVSQNYNANQLNLAEWETFLDVLCQDRYPVFFAFLQNGRLIEGKFRSALEALFLNEIGSESF